MPMRFLGMNPLLPGYPHIEVGVDGECFDLHNTGILATVCYQVEREELVLTWHVSNPLGSSHYGSYRTGSVALVIRGVAALSFEHSGDAEPDETLGLDSVEYQDDGADRGRLRFLLEPGGQITVSGAECELRVLHRADE